MKPHTSQGTPSQARLIPLRDGPYEVIGPLEITDRDGRTIDVPGPDLHLCRCGLSANKPFCDGSHVRDGWKEDA